MRGLHLDNEAYVELRQPKDMVEALKFAQIYDDIGCRSKGAFGKGKAKVSFSLKRKFFKKEKGGTGVSEFFRGQGGHWKKKLHPRKPKKQSKLAKKDKYDKAHKENLCFNWYKPGHAKVARPKL